MEDFFTAKLGEHKVTIKVYFAVGMDLILLSFDYLGQHYLFSPDMDAFGPRSLMERLCTHYEKNQFGVWAHMSQPPNKYVISSMDDKKRGGIQYCVDVLKTLDKIWRRYQAKALDYAAWYYEQHDKDSPYPQFITREACRLIFECNFMGGEVKWDLVEF